MLTAVGKEAVLSFIVGAAMAWGFHSTLAVILLIASFLANGSLELTGALGLILGLNFGGSFPAVSATFALPVAGRRLPVANLICRGLVAILGLILLPRISALFQLSSLNAMTTALGFHIIFNLVVGLLFLPVTTLVVRLTKWLMPDAQLDELQVSAPKYLDLKSLETPAVALSHATTETVRMSEILSRMLDVALMALQQNSTETLKLLKALDERLNNFQSAIQSYLVDLSQVQLPGAEARRALEQAASRLRDG